ncbi:hypothetical protein NN3_18270 [Nocardia neocaledoniensis NBRC 108232]|uniref:hypothetical protein n=1 Tax=Nocardia neocaledoniensis TaxID=236511 RepID=UPI001194E897|nr:hypothetical protein [Nocardia neocaledoniensis]GEM30820.1 hypothetical protein NN3_18270 [Nocardia neocaledoniensis NBRC 108232]
MPDLIDRYFERGAIVPESSGADRVFHPESAAQRRSDAEERDETDDEFFARFMRRYRDDLNSNAE